MAYFEMLERDRERMESCFVRVNRMPLGAARLPAPRIPLTGNMWRSFWAIPG